MGLPERPAVWHV